MKKILVVRPDRIGDVILSTPVVSALKAKYPESKISFWVQKNVAPLLRNWNELDEVLEVDPEESILNLRKFLVKKNFDAAIVLQSQRRISLAIWLAQIPIRIGPLSKPHSFIAFNRGVRQHRSRVEKHEADYNLDLLEPLGIRPATENLRTRVFVRDQVKTSAREWLQQNGIDLNRPLFAVHPGMGGSALNWPRENYQELIRKLLGEGRQVLVTAGPSEEKLIEEFREHCPGACFYGGLEAGSVEFLGGLLDQTQLVIAPSTGPLHIAVALGKPVLSFYPAIRVQSKARWGPYISGGQKAYVFEEKEGMKNLKVEDVLTVIRKEFQT